MGRKPRVDRSPEEKWQIVQEASRAGMSRRRVAVNVGRCSLSEQALPISSRDE